jgi:hypothetical protein
MNLPVAATFHNGFISLYESKSKSKGTLKKAKKG